MILETGKIRVLVVDDHAGMREGINAVVNAQPDMIVVGEASNGEDALQQFRDLQPDVSLLDWNLPRLRGEDVLAKITPEFPKARFIVITTLTDDDCIRRALELGARAFLHKDMLRRELLPAIRAVYRGQKYLPEPIADKIKNCC